MQAHILVRMQRSSSRLVAFIRTASDDSCGGGRAGNEARRTLHADENEATVHCCTDEPEQFPEGSRKVQTECR